MLRTQVILIGKFAAGILMATAAYRPPAEFKRLMGLEGVQLLRDARTDTVVRASSPECGSVSTLRACSSCEITAFSSPVTSLPSDLSLTSGWKTTPIATDGHREVSTPELVEIQPKSKMSGPVHGFGRCAAWLNFAMQAIRKQS